MDQQMIEQSVENSSEVDTHEDEDNSETPQLFDGQLQYQFKAENGQVTYRVVQVDANEHVPTIVSPSQSAVAQAIIAHAGNPFGGTSATNEQGPFYVMMAPQEIINTNTRTRKSTEGTRVARDEKRRATHNEVERRRRDKINNWIVKLSKVVPDCAQDHTKQGQSKGGILAKATEYIQELCLENTRLNEVMKENEMLSNELDAIRQQFVDAKNENRRLRSILSRNGIEDNV